MRKFVVLLPVMLLLCVLTTTFAQTRIATGKVTDEKGVPVENVSVQIKGSSIGVSADVKGVFKLVVKPTDILVFSATNFSQKEIKVGNLANLSVTLTRQVAIIDEVVVTALGIRRSKNSLPYAAQQVVGEEVTKTRNSNFINTLSGKVSGLEIRQNNTLGGSTNVVMRGFKSFTGNNQALFVIDGVPVDNSNTNTKDQTTGRGGYDYGNAAADINPDDIESLNVLKGAAATALYGSRASNGVIMVTTKKAKRGLGVIINSGITVGSIDKSTFATYQRQYGGGYGSLSSYGSPDGNFFYFDVNEDGHPDLVTPTTEDASWGAKFDPNLKVYQWNAFSPELPTYGKATPWVAGKNDPVTFFEKPVSTGTGVYVDGATDRGSFKLGYTKTDDNGIMPNSNIKKDVVNFGAAYNITDKLTAGATVNYSKVKGVGRYGTGYSGDVATNLMTMFREWWQTNVDVKEQKDAYFLSGGKNITWNPSDPTDAVNGAAPIYWNNPYWIRYKNYERDSRSRYLGNMSLNYNVTQWLSLLGRISLDSYNEIQEERVAIGSLEVPYYGRFNRTFSEYNYDFLATVNKDITSDLSFKALAGLNIRRTKISSVMASTNGGLSIPGIYALSNTKGPLLPPTETEVQLGVDGLFASTTIGFKEMLFLDLSGRRDKSSTLPTNSNAYFYPSASLGFVFSKLTQTIPWISYGKARVNYAEVGNSAPAKSLADYYVINPAFGNTALSSVSGNNSPSALTPVEVVKNNPNLKPEKTKSYEAGLEMAFLKNRLGFDFTYYNAKTIDQIVPASISRATGYDSKFINAGEIVNKGIEVSLYGTPVKLRDFSWNVNLNWSRNRNEVVDLGGEIDNLQLGSFQGGITINAALGQPYGTIRGQNFVYVNGQPLVKANGYYQKSATSNEIIGNINPDWIGGITNTFKYKNVSLSFLIDMRHGGDVFSLDMYYGLATGLYPETVANNDLGNPVRNLIANGGGIINPGVMSDGKKNTTRVDGSVKDDNGVAQTLFGLFGYYRKPAAAFVYDAGYTKLRELTLTYSFPEKCLDKIPAFKGIDISLVGRNLWIINKNLPYADPEEGISSGNLQGYQVGAYPTTRSIGVNLKLKF